MDFETYVRGYNEETKEEHDYETHAGVELQYFLDDNRCYQPFPFVPFNIDSSKYTYQQVVNHCECQYEDASVFTFSTIPELSEWLNLPINTGAIVVAHCGGIFDFHFLYKHFLSTDVLRMKKVKPPLLRGNKIVSAYIQNGIKLLDSYNFVTTALSKFAAIFQLEEVKKVFSLIFSIDQTCGIILVLFLPKSIISPISCIQ